MELKRNSAKALLYNTLLISLATLTSILPGILLVEERVTLSSELITFIAYLLLAEGSQLAIRLARKKGQVISLPIYGGKILISLSLIWILSGSFSPQYAIILVAYEVFQFLGFSEQYNFQQSIMHLLVAIFFKGAVFNLMLSLSFPYTFKLFYFGPYLFNILLLLTFGLIANYACKELPQRKANLLLAVVTLICLISFLIFKLQSKELTLFPTISMSVLIIISIILSRVKKLAAFNELLLLIPIILCQVIFYLH